MTKKKISFSLFIMLLIQQVSFSQDNPVIKYLPPGASMIMSFNPIALAAKVPGEDFRQSFFYRELMKENDGGLKAFFSDPSISGIDFSAGLVMATITDTTSGYPVPTYHVFGVLKNEQSFLQAAKKIIKTDETIQVYGTNKMIFSKKADPVLAWNNEVFVFTYGNSLKKLMTPEVVAYNDSTTYDTTAEKTESYNEEENEKKRELAEEEFRKEQRNYCFELLTPKNDNPLLANNYFTDLMKVSGDIRIWNSGSNYSMGRYIGLMPPQTKGILSRLQSLMGKNKTSIINFENGKITATARNYPETQMAHVYQKYPSQSLHTELALRLPQKEVLGLMMSSVNRDMAKEILQTTGLSAFTDSLKEKIPFDLNLLQSAFKNDMLLAVLKNNEDTKNASRGKLGGIDLILALPIADKQKFEELRSSFSRLIDSLKETEKGEKMFKDITPSIKYNDDLLVLSLSEKTATDFLNNNGTGTAPEWLQAYTSYPVIIEINMREIAGLMFRSKNGSVSAKDQEMAQKVHDFFDKTIFAGGRYENGSFHGVTEFRFGNKTENALKQIFDFLNSITEQNEHVKNESQSDFKKEVIIENNEEEKTPPPPPPKPPKNIKKGGK